MAVDGVGVDDTREATTINVNAIVTVTGDDVVVTDVGIRIVKVNAAL